MWSLCFSHNCPYMWIWAAKKRQTYKRHAGGWHDHSVSLWSKNVHSHFFCVSIRSQWTLIQLKRRNKGEVGEIQAHRINVFMSSTYQPAHCAHVSAVQVNGEHSLHTAWLSEMRKLDNQSVVCVYILCIWVQYVRSQTAHLTNACSVT